MLSPAPSSQTANTSFVVVTYFTGEVLFRMIESVLKQPETLELVLVNNGNPKDVEEKLAAMATQDPRVKLITGHGNVGFATATNMGAKAMAGDYLFILNPDCTLPDSLLKAFLQESKTRARPHLISCRVLDENGVEQSGSRRELLTPWQAFSEIFKAYRMFPDVMGLKRFNRHQDAVPSESVLMPAISGAVMFLPKEDYWLIDGLDGDYFLHVEDLDFCLRFNRAGGHIYFMPTPAITHVGGSSDVPKVKVEYLKSKSFVRYFCKNFAKQENPILLGLVILATWARFGVFAFMSVFRRCDQKIQDKISVG